MFPPKQHMQQNLRLICIQIFPNRFCYICCFPKQILLHMLFSIGNEKAFLNATHDGSFFWIVGLNSLLTIQKKLPSIQSTAVIPMYGKQLRWESVFHSFLSKLKKDKAKKRDLEIIGGGGHRGVTRKKIIFDSCNLFTINAQFTSYV